MIIFGVGVYLLVKSFTKIQTEKPVTLGKALLASLFMAVMAAIFNIGAYLHIQNNQKALFNEFKDKQVSMMINQLNSDQSLKPTVRAQKIREYTSNIETNLSTESFARTEIQMFLSIALVVTLLVYIANQKNT